METTLGRGRTIQLLAPLPATERILCAQDPVLGRIIGAQEIRWPARPTEDPIWGLVRIVMAQQISTQLACRLAENVKFAYAGVTAGLPFFPPAVAKLRAMGLPQSRAQCCVSILERSDEIRAKVQHGHPWEEALAGIKGIGPWTLSVFRIMVLREPDVLPLGDVGLERAIANVYGKRRSVERLSEKWRPFRSVACWYLWRTLGNEQLG
jgi:DNA-3-methyladenine glycosylase II